MTGWVDPRLGRQLSGLRRIVTARPRPFRYGAALGQDGALLRCHGCGTWTEDGTDTCGSCRAGGL